MDVVIPAQEAISRFSGIMSATFQRVVQNLRENTTLVATRDALLPKLLSGEIRVKDAERFVEAVL